LLQPEYIIINLKGSTKETVINELLDVLAAHGKMLDRDTALTSGARHSFQKSPAPLGYAFRHFEDTVYPQEPGTQCWGSRYGFPGRTEKPGWAFLSGLMTESLPSLG
jgi:hypothetical protein